MITCIELDGFKTFRSFKLELAPFQIIVGPNGAGKSNLFDALHLLSSLADTDLRSAFQGLRGDANELFTILPGGNPVDRMRMAVEMLLENQAQDSWGAQASIKYTRLRYELEIVRRTDDQGLERLYVHHESLELIKRGKDTWLKRAGPGAKRRLPQVTGGHAPFISTTTNEAGEATINLHQDGRAGRKASVAAKIERTVLSGVANTEFPHAFAAREEMRSWRFLQLNPEVLRQPSSMLAHDVLASDGGNLPTTLARMQAEEPGLLDDVSRDLANLVPGVEGIELESDRARNQYIVRIRVADDQRFSSRVLSDGTLRLLALVTLKNDPRHRGVLCFEEPENGVHPFRLRNLVTILQDLATDLSVEDQEGQPLRQLLVNTHSPVLASQPGVQQSLLFAYMITRIQPGEPHPLRVTRIVPVKPGYQLSLELGIDASEQAYTLAQVLKYLDSADIEQAHASLAAGNR